MIIAKRQIASRALSEDMDRIVPGERHALGRAVGGVVARLVVSALRTSYGLGLAKRSARVRPAKRSGRGLGNVLRSALSVATQWNPNVRLLCCVARPALRAFFDKRATQLLLGPGGSRTKLLPRR